MKASGENSEQTGAGHLGPSVPAAVRNGSPEIDPDIQEGAPDRALGSRAPSFIQRSSVLHTGWKIGVFIAGLGVVGVGIVLLPLPGPGWVVIFLGVALWGTEFVWAQLLLRWAKRKVTDTAKKAWDPAVRRRSLIILTVALVLVAAAAYLSVWEYGFVML